MGNRFKIGDIEVLAVSDGYAKFPAHVYFRGTTAEDWEPHKRWLDHEGNAEFPFACFLVRSGDRRVLIDTGLGWLKMGPFTGGALLAELAAGGVRPEDIDTVFVTHLHIDHCGTCAVRDGDTIAPGISVIATPGHTPGHAGVVLSSGTERAFVLGDALSCPAQLEETEWSGLGDMDPKLARRTQERVAQEIETSGALLATAHFPGLTFGRVLRGEGRRYWQPVLVNG